MGTAVQTDPREWLCLRLRVPINKAGATLVVGGPACKWGTVPIFLMVG